MLLSCVRYLMVGVISLLLALPMARQLRQLTAADAWMLLRLAVIGNLVYFVCLVPSSGGRPGRACWKQRRSCW
ncbi:hypothetical protein BL240_19815 [Pseudomonas putida]|uniref:EamA domain-containing protein n=1 Tax=Pseudomonas putida TaxID=303 RepID=A0A1L5PTQ9_PSEPU|nr:hypothetical protein BL240_19815 [Pseudomonas putida]